MSLTLNQLTALPPEIGRLTDLTELDLSGNQLSSLPLEIGQLTGLVGLGIADNQLSSLPPEIGRLTGLTWLFLEENPLPGAVTALARQSIAELLSYLRSLEDAAEPLFAAKLVLVGEGGVGKTSLLARLRGGGFFAGRATTHGIETHPIHLPHPDRQHGLALNAWDFGGQPVYRAAHQLFFTARALYLLLWNPRLGPEQCDVEGWLRRIRLRVGGQARVLVVATHAGAGGRLARIDEAGLRQKYGDLIAGFHEVDSESGAGIDDLKVKVASAAAA